MRQQVTKKGYALLLAVFCLLFLFSCDSSPSFSDSEIRADETIAVIQKAFQGKARIDSIHRDLQGDAVVFFYVTQPIDHENVAKGTFEQYCALHYKGSDRPTLLRTEGYAMQGANAYKKDDIVQILGANQIEVEHRYYGYSNAGGSLDWNDPGYWDYNTTAQATADLQEIVKALKATDDFGGKWISSGVSKDGMLTAMYAYRYPNEMDLYVPFCAPFLTDLNDIRVGTYLTQKCGRADTCILDGKTCYEMSIR